MQVFMTGATGYIGGSIAARLIERGHGVTGLVRSDEKAAQLKARGIVPVRGTLADFSTIVEAAAAADVVINTANADDSYSVDAIIKGLAGSNKAFIHTSGTSVVSDRAAGEYSAAVFNEDSPFEPLPERMLRVALDRAVLNAAQAGIRAVVIRPSLIYGRGHGLNPHSVQIPRLIDLARRHGVARHVGRGLNLWSHVHIDDIVALYLLALENAPACSLFYAENGEANFRSVTQSIGRMLGMGDTTKDWPIGEAVEGLGPGAYLSFGSNSRVRGKRARELGWVPRQGTLFDEIEKGVYAEVYGKS